MQLCWYLRCFFLKRPKCIRRSKSTKSRQIWETADLVSTSRKYLCKSVWDDIGYPKEKSPLLACHTRQKCSMEATRNSAKREILVTRPWIYGWSMEGITVYVHATCNYFTIGREGLHIVEIKVCLWNTLPLSATKSKKAIFNFHVKVKVTRSLTLVSFDRVSLVEYAC